MEKFFEDIRVTDRIRDPLYGFIYLTKSEKAIVDTPIFQRLRRIHQLALTKYVYPSAEHSRFVHSLGVMHCATLILSGIFENKKTDLYREPNPRMIKTLRFAALLHDIGHLPFSHAVEKQWLSGLKHEDLSQYIIEKHPRICEIIESDEVDPVTVSSLLAKQPLAQWRLPHEIISGQLDADRADYLLRDSHSCGVRYGEYDFSRFLQIFAATESISDGHLILSVDEADLHVAESLLVARYHYNMQIPYHRTRSGYDLALRKFIADIDDYKDIFVVKNGILDSVNMDRLEDMDDYTVIERAKIERRKNNKWANYVLRDNHLVPIVDTRKSWSCGSSQFKFSVSKLNDSNVFVNGDDFFVQEQDVELIKGVPLEVEDVECECRKPSVTNMIALMVSGGKKKKYEFVDIRERSWIFKQISSGPETIYRIYTTPDRADEARALIKQSEFQG